jgi:hypothetical protein
VKEAALPGATTTSAAMKHRMKLESEQLEREVKK